MSWTRPLTLQDILKSINDDAGQANSPDVVTDPTFSLLIPVSEMVHVSDGTAPGSVVAAVKSPGTWADGVTLWGTDVWVP